jgi:hypothetical protein
MRITAEQQALRRTRAKADRDRANREMSASKRAAGVTFLHGRVDEKVAAARLAEIPPDTRNLTQRIAGDPLPGRSALDRRNSMVAN